MIVAHAMQYVVQGHKVNVVADDTDVLVLLMYHWKHNMANIYFLSEANASQKKTMTVWKIRDLNAKAGETIISHLLFLHAWSGCDTTSATYGQGKTSLLKKIKESNEIKEISLLISQYDATAEKGKQCWYKIICHYLWWQTRRIFKQLKVLKVHENDIILQNSTRSSKASTN